jgi:hypothetical protein
LAAPLGTGRNGFQTDGDEAGRRRANVKWNADIPAVAAPHPGFWLQAPILFASQKRGCRSASNVASQTEAPCRDPIGDNFPSDYINLPETAV